MSSKRKIIAIYGGGSGSGKTSLAEFLLSSLVGWAAIKITPSPLFSRITLENPDSAPPGKDTGRLSRAGADPVIHLQVQRMDLEESFLQALLLIPPDRSILVEGKVAIRAQKPDISILVWRPDVEDPKGKLEDLAAGADLLFINGNVDMGPLTGTDIGKELDCMLIQGNLKEGLSDAQSRDLLAFLKSRDIL